MKGRMKIFNICSFKIPNVRIEKIWQRQQFKKEQLRTVSELVEDANEHI